MTDLVVGVVEEGFGRDGGDRLIDDGIRDAIDKIADGSATVETVSVPSFEIAPDIYTVAMLEGLVETIRSKGLGYNRRGWHDVAWAKSFGTARREWGGMFPATVKLGLLVGAFASEALSLGVLRPGREPPGGDDEDVR